jgi:hypothetical protein
MRTRFGRLSPLGLALLFAGCGAKSGGPAAGGEGVDVIEVTYQGLDAAVKEQVGKVVVIDVWYRG